MAPLAGYALIRMLGGSGIQKYFDIRLQYWRLQKPFESTLAGEAWTWRDNEDVGQVNEVQAK